METGIDDTPRGNEAPTRTLESPASNPNETPAPPGEHALSHIFLPPAEGSTPSGSCISSFVKPENWASFQGLMDTLKRTAGLGPVKGVMEGLVELIELYEDAAQGLTEFDDLRIQLEYTFDELNQHLSFSPAITTSMESICWSIQKEVDIFKTQQARPSTRKAKTNNNASQVLECYRRIQAHLQRLTRNANISTWKVVNQLAAENRLQKLASSLWECYNSIKANELNRGPCTTGTRIGVLAQMHHWATSPNTGTIYWMSGMAGTGKTTIAHTLCEQLDGKDNRMLCASFFCSRSLPECRDVGRIIPSIAYQLARCSQPFRYALSKATEQDPDAHTRLPQMQFETLIVGPLSDAEVRKAFPTNMVVVIDALDECDDTKSTKQILDVLLTKSKDLPIKFVVSSRPEPAIRDQMEKSGAWVDAQVVLHELESGEVRADIKTYLKAELDPIGPSEPEIDQLVARAGVLFIYAATAIRYIGYDDFSRNPRARLRAILSKTNQHVTAQTKDIDELYGIVLGAAFEDSALSEDEHSDMKLILDTVICARQPLTVAALNSLLKLDDVDRVRSALRPLWSVLHVMGPNMTVTTLHASFPDYLLDFKRSGTRSWHCDAAAHHHLIAQRCFECIQVVKPQFNICRLESSYLLDNEVADLGERVERLIPAELRYTCLYWSSHLDAAEPAKAQDLKLPLSQFLTTHLLLWMEVRNLTKTMAATLGELTATKRWATRHDMTRDAADLLNDAWRFASTFVFSPVSQSTPHLYTSMLPLLPPSSPIREKYFARFQGMIGVEGTALSRRKHEILAQWSIELDVGSVACSPDGARLAIGGSPGYPKIAHIFVLDAFRGNVLLDFCLGDEARVKSIAFSPDSTRLASGMRNGYISIWDIISGQVVLNPFKAHDRPVTSILFSHDGSRIVSATGGMTICIWDALSGESVHTLLIAGPGYTGSVTFIAISSDDALLISGSRDGTVRIWDVQSGSLVLGPITGANNEITAVPFSPDDSYIISGGSKGIIRVWDTQTGQMVLGPLLDQINSMKSVSISPDGATIASTRSNIDGVRISDAASGQTLSQLGPFSEDTDHSKLVMYSPDGTRIILARRDGTIRLLDAQTVSTASNPLPGHTDYIASLDVSPNGRLMVSGSSDSTLCVWDLPHGALHIDPLQGHTAAVNMVRFSPDGSRILSCSQDSTIRQWDAQSGAAVQGTLIKVASAGWQGVVSATYSPDGARILSLTGRGSLSVWTSCDGQSVLSLITTSDSPDGDFDESSGEYFDGGHPEFSPDGATVFVGYDDGSIAAWDATSGQQLYRNQGLGGSEMSSFAFSPNGLYYAHSFVEGKIRLGSVGTADQMSGLFEGHTSYISSMRFSSDGTRLVSGCCSNTIHVWDVETRQSLFGPPLWTP